METSGCSKNSLFDESARELFDQLVDRLFTEVESSTADVLTTYAGVFGAPPAGAADLNRLLGQGVKAALPRLLDRRLLGAMAKGMAGELVCTGRELRQKFAAAGLRPLEHDILYLVLYGFRHGLADSDIAAVPVNEVSFTFRIDPGFDRVELAEVQLEYLNRNAERSYLATRSSFGSIERFGTVASRTGSPEAINWFVWVLALPWQEIFQCLRSLVELIREALASGEEDRISEALDAIEDAMADIDGEIEDIEEEITDLKEDIREENDPDDKKELEDELKNLKDKKDILDDAREDLRDARRRLKKARRS